MGHRYLFPCFHISCPFPSNLTLRISPKRFRRSHHSRMYRSVHRHDHRGRRSGLRITKKKCLNGHISTMSGDAYQIVNNVSDIHRVLTSSQKQSRFSFLAPTNPSPGRFKSAEKANPIGGVADIFAERGGKSLRTRIGMVPSSEGSWAYVSSLKEQGPAKVDPRLSGTARERSAICSNLPRTGRAGLLIWSISAAAYDERIEWQTKQDPS